MAGYSGTPLPQKLGIKENHRLGLIGAPAGFERTLGALPGGVKVSARLSGKFNVIVFFTKEKLNFKNRLPKLMKSLDPAGGLWIAWPKKASRVPTDMTEDLVREVALPLGLVDNKVCALDEVWSGLRLVYRMENRPVQSRK